MKFSKQNTSIFTLCIGIGFIIFLILRWLGFDGLYGQDSYEYIRQAKEVKSAILGFQKPQDFYWAPGYPLALAILDVIIGNMIVTAQLLSVFTWGLTLFFLYSIARIHVKSQKHFIFLLIISCVGFSAYFFRIMFTSMSDGLAVLLITIGLYYFEKSRAEKTYHLLHWSILFLSLSVFTRYAALPLVIVTILSSFFLLFKNRLWGSSLISIGSILFVSVSFLYLKDKNPGEIVNSSISASWNIHNFWSNSIQNEQGTLTYFAPNIFYVLYPIAHFGFIWLSIPVFIWGWYQKIKVDSWTTIISLFVYCLFLAGIPFQNKRFLVLTIVPLFSILIPFIANICSNISKTRFIVLLTVITVLNLGVSLYSFEKVYQIQQTESALFENIRPIKMSRLYTFDVDLALQSRGLNVNVINLWKIESLEFKEGDYFLLNKIKWEDQWKDHLLMKNIEAITSNVNIFEIENYGNGWRLYKYE